MNVLKKCRRNKQAVIFKITIAAQQSILISFLHFNAKESPFKSAIRKILEYETTIDQEIILSY